VSRGHDDRGAFYFLLYTSSMWHVYLLLCKDKSIYCGITTDLKHRLLQHKNGKGGHYTRAHPPVRFLYSENVRTRGTALRREAEMKTWPRKKKISLAKIKPRSK